MAKTENYTPEMTARAVALYMEVRDMSDDVRAARVKAIAAELNRKEASIRAKLAREVIPGTTEAVYVPKTKTDKAGRVAARKSELVDKLKAVTGLNLSENMANAPKEDLHAVLAFINATLDRIDELENPDTGEVDTSGEEFTDNETEEVEG